MDVTMLQKIAIDLSDKTAELYAYYERLSRTEEVHDVPVSQYGAPPSELETLCSELRHMILRLSFVLGETYAGILADRKQLVDKAPAGRKRPSNFSEEQWN